MTNVGSILKIRVSLDLPGSLTMDDIDFMCEFFVYESKRVVVPKSEAIRVDADNYDALVDTSLTGVGRIKLTVTAELPDVKGMRQEIETITTGVEVYGMHKD